MAEVHTVTDDQLGAELRALDSRNRMAVRRGLRRAAHLGMAIVVADTPADRGFARAGWAVYIHPDGATLANDAPHAGILEAGSRPHWPPLMPILRWAVRKFGIDLSGLGAGSDLGEQEAGGGIQAAQHFDSIEEVPYTTYLFAKSVQESIAADGTEPHRMIGGNMVKLERIAQQQVDAQLRGT